MKLIYLMGNMCSGKSTLARNICEVLPHYQQFEIDEYRRRYKAHTLENEERAWNSLCGDLINSEYPILDTTGVGNRSLQFLEMLKAQKNVKVLIMMLEVSEHKARQRFAQREKEGYQQPPFPYSTTRWISFERVNQKLGTHLVHVRINTVSLNKDQVLAKALDAMEEADFY